MSDWKKGFTEAVSKVVLANGTPAHHEDDDDRDPEYGGHYTYGWTYSYYHNDYKEIREHAKTCKFTASVARAI